MKFHYFRVSNLSFKHALRLLLFVAAGFWVAACAEDEANSSESKFKVTSIEPENAAVGSTITIKGVGFGKDIASNKVEFYGNIEAEITSASTTELAVIVPEGATTGSITVTVNNKKATSSEQDFVINPIFTDFSPKNGLVGTAVTITGSGFSPTKANNIVTFNDIAAVVTEATSTSLTVSVPGTGSNGKISVQNGAGKATSTEDFIYIPKIQSISASMGAVGKRITIEGSGFNIVSAQNTVEFNEVAATIISSTANSIVATVPEGATSGMISVTTSGYTANGPDFQIFVEAVHAGGSEYEAGFAVAIDAAGNSYVTGSFNGNITFGSTVLIPDNEDIFVAKYNSALEFQWAKKIGGAGADRGMSIALDNSGKIYISGYYSNSPFIAQLDENGNTLWSSAYGTSGAFPNLALQGDNLLVAGNFGSSISIGATNLVASGAFDMVVAKFNKNTGLPTWAKKFGETDDDFAQGVAVASTGDIYVSGSTFGNVTIGATTLSVVGGLDALIFKLDTDGTPVWAKQMTGNSWENALAVTLDLDENPIVTGYFTNILTIGATTLQSAGNEDMFVARFSASNGNLMWSAKGGGGNYDLGHDVTTDASGNIYVTGYFEGAATFGSVNLPFTNSSRDIFVIKYNSQGTFQWLKKGGGDESDASNGIAIGADGIIYVTGHYRNFPVTLESTTFENAGGDDFFLWKILQ